MKCRKCGAEIADNSIRCSNCGIKVNMLCPECHTLNAFGSMFCSGCGSELLKKCSSCNTINIASAQTCRKCGQPLDEKFEITLPEIKEEQVIVNSFSTEINEVQTNNNSNEEDNILSELLETESDPEMNLQTEPELQKVSESIIGLEQILTDEPEQNNQVQPVIREIKSDDVENNTETQSNAEISENIENANVAENVENEIDKIESDVDIIPLNEIEDYDVRESLDNENDDSTIETNNEDYSVIEVQPEAVEKAVKSITTSISKHILAIHGPSGCGKTAVLRQTQQCLSKKNWLFLFGSCTPLLQITSFGFFQDAFLRIMGFPPYTNSFEAFFKDFKKSPLAKIFNFLNDDELSIFLNIIYPSQKDKFENISKNKQLMFTILEKVIKSFSLNNNLVITIDNFELLDGASYDFIVYMLQNGYFNNRLKLLIAYEEDKQVQSYFDMTKIKDEIFEVIEINKLGKSDMLEAVKRSLHIDITNILDEDYLDEIIEKSDGNALRIEQEVALLFNCGYISVNNNDIIVNSDNKPSIDPVSFAELIKLRLNTLSPVIKNVLFISAIMGLRFAPAVLAPTVNMPDDKLQSILDYLREELYIDFVDDYTCEFKSLELWKLIYQEAKSDLLYKENSQKLYDVLKSLVLSTNLQKLISCTGALSKNDEFLIWQETAKISAKLGDTNLYVISLKQCLKIMEEVNFENAEELKITYYENLGKLLCEKSAEEAVSYLANVLDYHIKSENLKKILDLSSYFIKSCYVSGNYFGITEAVDAVIAAVSGSETGISDGELALLKTRKLKALFNIGNSEQIINLFNEEIIPSIELDLYSRQIDSKYKSLLVDGWLCAKSVLAKAYALQGNNQVFSVIADLRSFIEKYNYDPDFYVIQINLIEAFANTVIGQVNKSNEILGDIASNAKSSNMESELLSEWNIINVINRILLNQNDGLKSDLFELATFTNNINEHFIKNIIKLILGYVLKQEGNIKKALEIFNEEITYFAKEKVAIGALLSWLLIVQITIDMGDDDKALSTANKSLEIAQSPKINNYFFIIYFQKLIAEIYLRKGDFNAAKMYFEKAVTLAKQFELKYQVAELYMAYGNYMEEFMKANTSFTDENMSITSQMYDKALETAKELRLNNLVEKASKLKNDFKTTVRLNSAYK